MFKKFFNFLISCFTISESQLSIGQVILKDLTIINTMIGMNLVTSRVPNKLVRAITMTASLLSSVIAIFV